VIRVALDAMGGDFAPATPVRGAVDAVREFPPSFDVQLVGRRGDIEAELARHGARDARIRIVDAAEVIGMGEKPLAAIRSKRQSSIRVGIELQKAGESDAFISAGNTGAVMAASTLLLGLHPGVERPAIGALFPTGAKPVLVLDCGANVDCSPRELRGFAHIGTVYARDVLGREQPRVGLLNIGEEEEKGNEATRGAYELLRADLGLRFAGNVEGRDVLHGDCDVVVCDGFVGNVVLKFYETVAHLFRGLLEREMEREVLQSDGMRRIAKVLDYAEYGGAPLLGVRGVSIICHGGSPARAIKNAIGVAVQAIESKLSLHIAEEFAGDGAAA
jgi:glycerol-3-phosphate acyltransferase PlsX